MVNDMQCDEQYYEADTGYMCWLTKEKCNKNKCILKLKQAKEFARAVGNELEKESDEL